MNNQNNFKAILESLLFAASEPLSLSKISEILGLEAPAVEELIEELKNDYLNNNRGLRLLENDHYYSLVTAPEASSYLQKMIKVNFEGELSGAALETLAIIGYRGPLSRAEIDEIRGVNSYYLLRTLLIRGLIEREVHPQHPNTFIYRLSSDFLKFLGLSSVKELPDYKNFQEKLKEIIAEEPKII